MSKQVVAEVIALIELGMIAPEDIVKCLRKANSEPEPAPVQEPVGLVIGGVLVKSALPEKYTGYLYTTPPAQRTWVRLTDEKIEIINDSMCGEREFEVLFARAIEAKLKEKNT